MDLTPYLGWLKFLHIAGAFVFIAGHGVSMATVFRLRHERDATRMLAMLDLSAWSLNVTLVGLIVLLVSGIVSGIAGNWFGQGWIWVAIVLLIGISIAMTPLATAYLNPIRRALGQRTREVKASQPDPIPLPIDQVLLLTQSRRPEMTLLIGGGGLLVILWLMVFKPF